MINGPDIAERVREKVATEHGFQLYKRYSEKQAAERISWDYSTLKRKRRAGLVPFVDMGGGSVGYMGYHIADIIIFGVKAREAWPNTQDTSSNAVTGGSDASPDVTAGSAVDPKMHRPSVSALALSMLKKRSNG